MPAAVHSTAAPLLRIDNLNKRFGGLQAIGNVNLSLYGGQITTLVDPNGAGKTTLFNMITGHITPTRGEIRWQDRCITGHRPWNIAWLGIARTFQDPRSFDRFVALLREVAASGVMIYIIEHNLDIVTQLSDRVVFPDQGRLLAEGSANEVLSDPHLASIYFGERTSPPALSWKAGA